VLKGAMFFSAEFSAPWGFDAPAAQDLAPMLAPGAPHLLIYHFLVEGFGAGPNRKRVTHPSGTGGRHCSASRTCSRNA
jgi:hypothetical protein